MASRRFSIEAIFKARDEWTGKLRKMSGSVEGLNTKLAKNLAKSKSFGKSWDEATAPLKSGARVVAGAGVAAGVAAGAVLKDITDEGAAFEKTMASAATKFGDAAAVGTEQFKGLESAALNVGGATEHSAAEAAGALKFMAMAGEDPAVALRVLKENADLATAAEADLARATDIVSDSIGPMMGNITDADERVKAYRKTMDLMTHATTRGNQDLEAFFEAQKVGAAVFRKSGQEIEQFTSATVVLSNAGIKGSKAGKDLARIMSNLTAATPKARKAMAKIKFDPFTVKDGKRVTKSFDVMMQELAPKIAQLDDKQRAQFFADVIGKNSRATAEALLENSAALTTFANEAKDATGLTSKQAQDMRNTTEGMLKGMDSALSAVKLEIFQVIKDDLKEIVGETTKWLKANKGAISEQFKAGLKWVRENFKGIVKWGRRIGKLVIAFTALDVAIKGVRTGLMMVQAIKWGAGVAKTFVTGVDDMTGAMTKLRTAGLATDHLIGQMGPKMQIFAKAGGLVGAAFVGWNLGRIIDDATGASDAIAGLMAEMTGLQAEIDRANRLNERAAAKSDAEILARKQSDLNELSRLIDEGGIMDTMSGVTEERMREATRLKSEIAKLKAQASRAQTMEAMGFNPKERAAVRAFEAKLDARGNLMDAEAAGASAEELERLRTALAEAEANLAVFKTPPGMADAGEAVAKTVKETAVDPRFTPDKLAAGVPANDVMLGGPQVPQVPEKGMSREQLEQMLMQQALMIQELQKANQRQDRLSVNITTAPGVDAEAETSSGGVTVQRTGTGV